MNSPILRRLEQIFSIFTPVDLYNSSKYDKIYIFYIVISSFFDEKMLNSHLLILVILVTYIRLFLFYDG